MRYNTAIAHADQLRPNSIGSELKFSWLAELDGKIYELMGKKPYEKAVESISKTKTEGTTDTYTIYYTDSTTSEMTVRNSTGGVGVDSITKVQTIGSIDTYAKNYSDGSIKTFDVYNGLTVSDEYPNDADLLVPFPYDNIYELYLIAMIDIYNQDTVLYQSDYALFNNAYDEAKAYIRRNFNPNKDQMFEVM